MRWMAFGIGAYCGGGRAGAGRAGDADLRNFSKPTDEAASAPGTGNAFVTIDDLANTHQIHIGLDRSERHGNGLAHPLLHDRSVAGTVGSRHQDDRPFRAFRRG